MNFFAVFHVVSVIVAVIGGFILTAVPVSWTMHDPVYVRWELFGCGLFTLVCGVIGCYATRKH
ncbi:hypothetical protein BVX99_03495, partial [bacterium F16]